MLEKIKRESNIGKDKTADNTERQRSQDVSVHDFLNIKQIFRVQHKYIETIIN